MHLLHRQDRRLAYQGLWLHQTTLIVHGLIINLFWIKSMTKIMKILNLDFLLHNRLLRVPVHALATLSLQFDWPYLLSQFFHLFFQETTFLCQQLFVVRFRLYYFLLDFIFFLVGAFAGSNFFVLFPKDLVLALQEETFSPLFFEFEVDRVYLNSSVERFLVFLLDDDGLGLRLRCGGVGDGEGFAHVFLPLQVVDDLLFYL